MINIVNKEGDNLAEVLGIDAETTEKMVDELADYAAETMTGFVKVMDDTAQACEKYKKEDGGGFEKAMEENIDKPAKDYFLENICQASSLTKFYDIVAKYVEDETVKIVIATDFSSRLYFTYKDYMERKNNVPNLSASLQALGEMLASAQ